MKFQVPSTKLQINLKSLFFNDQNRFDILNFGHCDLPFDSFDLEALDRLAQGGESFDFAQDREPVERLVEPFDICVL
jgi:hypothetical protein